MKSKVAPTAVSLKFEEMRTLALSALGGALEFYDFVVFVFFTKTLSHLFFPADMPDWLSELQVYGIFAAGYLARPIGGIIMAHFGDKSGRKGMFALSVFLMALPTLCIGLLPTYAQIGIAAPLVLLLLRVVQGIAIGGEVPAAWVFVAEHVPVHRLGFACATLTSGLTFGILLGSLFAAFIHTHFTETELMSYAWRIPFLVGGVFGFFAVWLRRWLRETPVFEEMRANKKLSQDIPLKLVLKSHRAAVVRSMLVTWTLTAGIVVVILMTPNLVQKSFGIPAETAFLANSLSCFMLVLGCLIGGWLVDRIGVARALLYGSAGLFTGTYLLYWSLALNYDYFIGLSILAGLLTGVTGVIPSVMVKSFPPSVRFSGISFSYNMAYAICGAMTPPLISYMSSHLGSIAPAHYVAVASLVGMAIGLNLTKKPQSLSD